MESSKFGNWLHVGANVGILAGLMLVFAQLQQTNTITSAELFSDNLESVITRELALLGETPELSMSRVLFEPETATREDYFVIDRVYSAILYQLRRAILLSDAGFYGTSENIDARGFVNLNYRIFASPYGLSWLDQAAEEWMPTPKVSEYLLLMRELASHESAADHMSKRIRRAESLVEKVEEVSQ